MHSAGVRVRLGARGAKRKNTPHHADCLSFARAGDCGPDRERNSSDFRDILKRFPQAGETRLAKPAARLNYATSPLRENSMLHFKTAMSGIAKAKTPSNQGPEAHRTRLLLGG